MNKFDNVHMRVAEVYSEVSSARRLQVGCVIVKNNTIIGIGYNGMPSGWDNNCEDEIGEVINGADKIVEIRLKTKPEALHAESNALAKVARSTNSSEGATLYVTHAPCLECSKLIYQSGINSVFYRNEYRDSAGINFLNKCKVHVNKI